MPFSLLSAQRLQSVKRAFTTRRVPMNAMATLLVGHYKPRAGDIVLARVTSIQQHKTLHLTKERKSSLFLGDEILVCYGDRYAPDQFEAEIPTDLGPCHLAASGGIASRVLSKNDRLKPPTTIEPIGLIGDRHGYPINIQDFSLPHKSATTRLHPTVIAVVGSAMNSGKTTVAAHVIKGLVNAGKSVNAGKITGTGAGGDVWLMEDAGADRVLDFTDAGYPTTYRLKPEKIKSIFDCLMTHLASDHPDYIVLEIADGLYQPETSHLLSSEYFRNAIDGLLFAARGAVDAFGGVTWLHQQGLCPLAISGLLTSSPLATREAKVATGLPVLTLSQLSQESAIAPSNVAAFTLTTERVAS